MRRTNERGPAATNDRPPKDTTNGSIVSHSADERKALHDIAARLALAGYSLYGLAVGGFLIARHDRTAHAADLRQARAFLDALGGQR